MRWLDRVDGDDAPGPVLSARQGSIAAQLREMIGEGPAAFSDTCLILSWDPRPAAASHIVHTFCATWRALSDRFCSRHRCPRGRKARTGIRPKFVPS
jgi:hypothetical protein